jgi:hypothetical protein
VTRFETAGLEPDVAKLLQGIDVDSLAIPLAGDEVAFERLRAFHDTMHGEWPATERLQEGSEVLLGRTCFSAVSLDGWLIGAKYRHTTAGDHSNEPIYVVATASVYSDTPICWRLTDGARDSYDDSFELTVEGYEQSRPTLSVVEAEPLPLQERVQREIARQKEEHRRKLNSIRVRIGSKVAWQLLRQDYKTEPLQSTASLLASVQLARDNGLVATSSALQSPMTQEFIDNNG